eukprot:TRINITY_DN8056_c0_g2_i2.p1 TRINITY_DN8056_c0_g2~~TRINITY_DN8056_c0_g2_i2.p1  ORF type:complete len:559 (+),score=121.59 TRINITY_DN8056_c0_g2_i2:86-1762(+)
MFSVMIALILVSASVCHGIDVPIVQTPSGQVAGSLGQNWDSSKTIFAYKGIPYAQQPIDGLRFSDPVEMQPWDQILNATEYQPACPQVCHDEPHVCPTKFSESCLYLNIFVPSSAFEPSSPALPVMVWFPGGNYEVESAGEPLYDGSLLAANNVIVVTVSYRLGALGFAALNVGGLDGFYGVKDQVMALKWVNKNIASFNGDNQQVTIFGQSAGASSVAFHLTSAKSYSRNYFQKVIMQSNPIAIYYKSVAQANKEGMALAVKLNCSDAQTYDNLTQAEALEVVECMRAVPADVIGAVSHDVGMGYEPLLPHVVNNVYDWSPYIDQDWLHGQPLDLMRQGQLANVSLIIGTTHDEALQWVYQPIKQPVTLLEYDAALVAIFGEDGPSIGKQYPVPDALRNDTRPVMADIGTAYTFHCGMRAGGAALADKLPQVYMYTFDHILSYKECWGPEFYFCETAVCHGAEIPPLFGTWRLYYNSTDIEVRLGNDMRAYWTNFARGNFTASGGLAGARADSPVWELYDPQVDNWMRFQVEPELGMINKPYPKCDFWDQLDGYGKF